MLYYSTEELILKADHPLHYTGLAAPPGGLYTCNPFNNSTLDHNQLEDHVERRYNLEIR